MPDMEETLTILGPGPLEPVEGFCVTRCGMHARVMRKTPFKLVFTSLSQYSSVVDSKGMEVGFTPAQLNT